MKKVLLERFGYTPVGTFGKMKKIKSWASLQNAKVQAKLALRWSNIDAEDRAELKCVAIFSAAIATISIFFRIIF
jgi:hypothetical protein